MSAKAYYLAKKTTVCEIAKAGSYTIAINPIVEESMDGSATYVVESYVRQSLKSGIELEYMGCWQGKKNLITVFRTIDTNTDTYVEIPVTKLSVSVTNALQVVAAVSAHMPPTQTQMLDDELASAFDESPSTPEKATRRAAAAQVNQTHYKDVPLYGAFS